jgi:hypothetical protein
MKVCIDEIGSRYMIVMDSHEFCSINAGMKVVTHARNLGFFPEDTEISTEIFDQCATFVKLTDRALGPEGNHGTEKKDSKKEDSFKVEEEIDSEENQS